MKKIIALLLIAALLPIFTVAASVMPDDIKLTKYESAISELMNLKIMKGYEDGTFKPEATLTRAEFSAIIIRALGMEELALADEGVKQFTDVPLQHWGVGYINLAAELEIINGYGDGLFGPEDKVTGTQALKMLVSTLGYNKMAQEKGGYPVGYSTTASALGITKGVNFSIDLPISRGDVAKLVQNAMNTKLMEKKYINGKENYEISNDKTLRTKLFDSLGLVKMQGIVTKDELTDLYNESSVKDGEIAINDIKYEIDQSIANDLLGYSVIYYAQDEEKANSSQQIIYSVSKDNKNQTLTIIPGNIIDVGEDSIKYYSENNTSKSETVKLADNHVTIYNGKYFKDAKPQDWKINCGQITLLDNNNDDEYDVVFVKAYTTFMVDSVDTKNSKINLKVFSENGESRFLGKTHIDYSDKSTKIRIKNPDGQALGVEDLEANQIICVFSSFDGNSITIIPAYETISGSVEETGSDGEVVIKSTKYKIAKTNAGAYIMALEAGDEGTFWLDINGLLTAKSVTKQGYGSDVQSINDDVICSYIIKSGVSSGLSKTVQLKVLSNLKNNKREEKIFTLADKVDVNGTNKTSTQALETLETTNGGINQPITYELNGKSEINKIYTFKQLADSSLKTYYSTNSSFDNLYTIDKNAITYFVDNNDNEKVYGNSQIKLENNNKYNVKIYDPIAGDFSIENRIFVVYVDLRYAGITQADSNRPMLVKSVSSYIDAENQTRYNIEGLIGDELEKLNLDVDQNKNIGKLKRGSVIRITKNGLGEIKEFKLLATLPMQSMYRTGTGGTNEQLNGRAYSIESNSNYTSCVLTLGYEKYNKIEKVSYEVTGKPVYLYTPSSGKVEAGTLNDISTAEFVGESSASIVFVSVVNFDVKAIIVIRK